MLHYRDRKRRVQIITMSPVIASDIYERLHNYPGMESVELILPGNGESEIKVEDIQNLARDTVKSSILIMDVCSWTRPQLQQAYSDIVRFNRPDFNRYCYSVLIGDIPLGYDRSQKVNDVHNFLSDMRVDFSPAVFFINPFSHYSAEERETILTYRDKLFPDKIPQRFGKYFKEQLPSFKRLAVYFRAADVQDDKKLIKRKKRLRVLKKLCIKMIEEDFPANKEQLMKGLSKEGYSMPGEPLSINIYPFFFEEWVLDLIKKAESAV